jgi:hypothetical protein
MDGIDLQIGEADERAARRMARLGTLAFTREITGATIGLLSEGIAGTLPGAEQERFDRRSGDPCLAMSRMSHELCRLVMLEERLDEDAETREKRLAEEQAARERKAKAEIEALKRDAEVSVLLEKKRVARAAVGRIYLDVNPKTTEMELNRLLDELLEDYELDLHDDLEQAYGDVTAAVIRLCEELEIKAVKNDGTADKTPEKARARLVALVENEIDMVIREGAANANGDAEPVRALAQGPPE